MDAEIIYDGPVPPWKQLAAILRAGIADGTYPAGKAIPSKRSIHERTGLAFPTITKAVNALKAEGLIEPVAGMGLYVLPLETSDQA